MKDQINIIREAYMRGWIESSKWANRDDLIADIGSGAYKHDADAALSDLEEIYCRPVGKVDGDGQVTWFDPIPENGANLYASPVFNDEDSFEIALNQILWVIQDYLPPHGIDINTAMSRIISIIDPGPKGWKPKNRRFSIE